MARGIYVYPEQINPIIQSPYITKPFITHKQFLLQNHHHFTIKAASSSSSSKKDKLPQPPQIKRKEITRKSRRSLITIATSEGKQGTNNYIFSLEELSLADLAEDGQKDTEVFISVTVDKHVGFGFSIGGKIVTSFTRSCINCCSPYCREVVSSKEFGILFSVFLYGSLHHLESPFLHNNFLLDQINATFDVWLLPMAREKHSNPLPEIGGDDPNVIYVKPGDQADIDSLVRDTIRLSTSVNETCSEACKKAEPRVEYFGAQEVSMDGRWAKLLELKKKL